MARTYTDEQRAEAVAVYAAEGMAAAHAATGVPKGTIKDWANKADVSAPEHADGKTAAAIKARTEQMERARWDIAEGLVDDIARLRGQLFAPCTERKVVTIAGSVKEKGTWEIVDIDRDQPTFTDQRAIMTTLAIAVDKVQVLTGGATARTEHRYETGIDREIAALTDALAGNDPEPAGV